mgnify:CR=1 FL=1
MKVLDKIVNIDDMVSEMDRGYATRPLEDLYTFLVNLLNRISGYFKS